MGAYREGGPVEPVTVADRHDAVCVIGAGGSGLAAVKNLREHGFAVDCYERETSVGGSWNWRHDRSPVYAGTRLVSSRPLAELPDFPMPDTWPDYPDHVEVLAYLERYVEHFDLRRHVWFGTEVVSVVPVDGGKWDVTTHSTGGGASLTQRYAAVVVANGHHWSPNVVRHDGWDGFAGTVIHASAYKDPAQLRGRRVLVVGGGNSGCDIAVEAAEQAARCWHATRRGYWVVPRYLFGRPTDQLGARLAAWRLPLRVRQWLHRRALRVVVGDLTRLGLPAPDHRPYDIHPVVNSRLVDEVRHGRVVPVPDVTRFDGRSVQLADGRRIEPDLVIMATGFLPRFDFLAPGLLDSDESGRPDLHLHAFARRHPTLSVVGLPQAEAGLFPLAHWQSVAVARWLRLHRDDPQRAARVFDAQTRRPDRRWARRGDAASPRYWFEVGHVEYLRALDGLLQDLAGAR
jgi:hypothetical protein